MEFLVQNCLEANMYLLHPSIVTMWQWQYDSNLWHPTDP